MKRVHAADALIVMLWLLWPKTTCMWGGWVEWPFYVMLGLQPVQIQICYQNLKWPNDVYLDFRSAFGCLRIWKHLEKVFCKFINFILFLCKYMSPPCHFYSIPHSQNSVINQHWEYFKYWKHYFEQDLSKNTPSALSQSIGLKNILRVGTFIL